MDPDAHDSAPEAAGAAYQGELLGSSQVFTLLQLLDGARIEAEDEVGLGLESAADPESILGKADSQPEQIFLEDRLLGYIRVFFNEVIHLGEAVFFDLVTHGSFAEISRFPEPRKG